MLKEFVVFVANGIISSARSHGQERHLVEALEGPSGEILTIILKDLDHHQNDFLAFYEKVVVIENKNQAAEQILDELKKLLLK